MKPGTIVVKVADLNIVSGEGELATLTVERKSWEQRLALVRIDAVDRDLLEENAREILGRTHKNDVVIMGR